MDNEKTLTTITYADAEENPVVSICFGHVDSKTFHKAWAEEGWEGDEPTDLSHEHWALNESTELWEKSAEGDPKAVKMTVLDW